MPATVTAFTTAGGGKTGNGQIDGDPTAANNEAHLFWTHLSVAGLIEGNYAAASWASPTYGTTSPKSKMTNAGWNIRWVGSVGNDDTVVGATGATTNVMYEGNYGNAFFFMNAVTLASPTAASGVLKAEEAWNIDTKMDDGKPATGAVTALEIQGAATPGGCGNAAGSTGATAVTVAYDLPNTSRSACSLVFKLGY